MKLLQSLLIIIVIVAVAFTCSYGQPFAEIRLRQHQFNDKIITTVDSIYQFWNNRSNINATPGSNYQYILGDDTLRFFKAPAGKKIVAKITFEEFGVVTPPVDPPVPPTQTYVIDNVPNMLVGGQLVNTYQPAWTHANQAGHVFGTFSYHNLTNAKLDVKFSGHTVKWIAEKEKTHGIAEVLIDGVSQGNIDTYSPTLLKQQVVFTKSGLTNGPHILTIRVTGTKNPASSGAYVVHDAVSIDF